MAIDYTLDTLVDTLQLLPLMPSVQALFTPAQFGTILDFEMMNKLYPIASNAAEEYFVYYYDQAYNQSVFDYYLPYRAIGNRLREVCFVDTTGQEVLIDRLRPEEIASKMDIRGQTLSPFKVGFYLVNNRIRLYFNNWGGTASFPTIRMKYLRQPNNLVYQSAVAQVSTINSATNQITVTATPPTTYSTAVTYDFISNVPPFIAWADDVKCTNITGSVMTFSSSVPAGLQTGDWVCLSGQSPVPQIPVSGINYLLQLGAAKCLEIQGDAQGFQIAKAQADEMKQYFIDVITPRVDGNPIKLSSTDSIWDNS